MHIFIWYDILLNNFDSLEINLQNFTERNKAVSILYYVNKNYCINHYLDERDNLQVTLEAIVHQYMYVCSLCSGYFNKRIR